MRDYLNIGPSPSGEDCAQLGSPNYYEEARKECKRFKEMLEKLFPPPDGAYFSIKAFPHDFGTYYEVVCIFDTESEEQANWALDVEANTPEFWDEV